MKIINRLCYLIIIIILSSCNFNNCSINKIILVDEGIDILNDRIYRNVDDKEYSFDEKNRVIRRTFDYGSSTDLCELHLKYNGDFLTETYMERFIYTNQRTYQLFSTCKSELYYTNGNLTLVKEYNKTIYIGYGENWNDEYIISYTDLPIIISDSNRNLINILFLNSCYDNIFNDKLLKIGSLPQKLVKSIITKKDGQITSRLNLNYVIDENNRINIIEKEVKMLGETNKKIYNISYDCD